VWLRPKTISTSSNLSRDGSAEEALKQIEDMGYAREYAADGRKIYQIGCNFSSKTGTIDGWKMK
jgi:hypothetical protein